MDSNKLLELRREIEMHVEKYCCGGCGPKARSCGRLLAEEVAADIVEIFERELKKEKGDDNGN